ncbi:protein-disulfide reductase DsbD [Arcobacter arenosus]|uniref:protein-disulfide reductase DsbD n=1 Tax=Arcobacter arenosus TaxID=2576037 RepID=UPI001E5B67DC|nr:protein-disulfide reductase DsbD [Arcobacter arenosus]
MIKKLLILIFFSIYAFANQDFLEPEEAFKTSFEKKDENVIFSIKLGKDIYLYDDKLKFLITKPQKVDIRNDLDIPESKEYEIWQIHNHDMDIKIPYALLKEKTNNASNIEITVEFQGCSKAGLCYAPMSTSENIDFSNASSANEIKEEVQAQTNQVQEETLNETDAIANTLKSGNILIVLATFFGFGLLLSLTPCVFPMIPILSSIIVKAGDSGTLTASKGFFLSLVYVLSMAAAYTIAGVLAGVFGANLQVALQNPYVLVAFSAIFVALAFSMFGFFKLELPQSIQNKINKTTDGKEKQGVLGIAIMGFLSALIVGPCVAPPLAGALVYIGQTGDAFLGGAALFVMSMGMGIPLLLIGLGAGKYMPKPGGWMENVTKIFGIVMLGVAVWMLDRVLDATIVMFMWALLLIGAALYLKVFEHIIAKLITTVIMIYGVLIFVGAVSGATNPLNPLDKFTSGVAISQNVEELSWSKVKTNEQINLAVKASSKPVMLDFYADWCISCKELEAITFKDPRVIAKLKEFTLLKADVTENNEDDKAMQKRFGVVGPPGLIFWNKEGKEIKAAQIAGYKNPEEFLKLLDTHF